LRFSVIGQLLAAPPGKGELRSAIEELAARTWQHPSTGEPVRFGFSTIERWYYRALRERADPVGSLRRKLRADAGQQHTISDAVRRELLAQYAAHRSWSVQLHHDNLVALALTRPDLQPVPSYATLRRFMRANGLDKRRRLTPRATDGAERAEARIVEREVRRYEAEYVNGLWHWDCHHGSRKVITARGEWVTPSPSAASPSSPSTSPSPLPPAYRACAASACRGKGAFCFTQPKTLSTSSAVASTASATPSASRSPISTSSSSPRPLSVSTWRPTVAIAPRPSRA
jgi:hypothetical protein